MAQMSTQATTGISDYRINKIRSYCKFLNANNDGFITKEDHELAVMNMAEVCNASTKEVEHMERTLTHWWEFYRGGKENVTKVPIPEVVQRAIAFCTTKDLTEAQNKTRAAHGQMFDLVDRNKDGSITAEELRIYYKSYRVHDEDFINAVFKRIDEDRDGLISREEYVEAHVAFWYSDDPENGCEYLYDVSK
ncbi:luciferin-binding protein-like [Liolophura sinensis]|uniref:luciferin-binding protein-like n=1 Tax=Liolophura sinensis TaxID=3198878 RepID=UPI0031583AD1